MEWNQKKKNLNTSINNFFGLYKYKSFLSGLYPIVSNGLFGLLYCDVFNYAINNKKILVKDLIKKKKEIGAQWDAVFFKSEIVLVKSINEAHKNIMMVYETQMHEFNEKTIQILFEKFIEIISDKYKDNE